MESCELCNNQAKLYCESEEARLCWDCDGKVHSANFLVAKHSRSLLCNVCQKQTPWKASGAKLSPTISVCENCFHGCDIKPRREQEMGINQQPERRHHQEVEDQQELSDTETEDDGEYSDDDGVEDEDEEDDGENQVVPWSPSLHEPPVACSSSSGEVDRDGGISTLKRMHHPTAYLDAENEDGCSSQFNNIAASMQCVNGMASSSSSTFRPLKISRTSEFVIDPERRSIINFTIEQ